MNRPQSEQELLQRALMMAGLTLGELAAQIGVNCPENLQRDKGWVGQLFEVFLGATAGSKPTQDFEELGVELKSIPVGHDGRPLETTFVSVAPLTGIRGLRWENSHVRNKLSRVLWIPVEGEREIPVCDRHVGMPMLWSPSPEEEAQLRNDWEELLDLVSLGKIESITARHGEYLQMRPKAANGRVLTDAFGENGQPIRTLPRGFYLRKSFTEQLLRRYYA